MAAGLGRGDPLLEPAVVLAVPGHDFLPDSMGSVTRDSNAWAAVMFAFDQRSRWHSRWACDHLYDAMFWGLPDGPVPGYFPASLPLVTAPYAFGFDMDL